MVVHTTDSKPKVAHLSESVSTAHGGYHCLLFLSAAVLSCGFVVQVRDALLQKLQSQSHQAICSLSFLTA